MTPAIKKTLLASPPRPGKIAGKELLLLAAITLLGLLLRLHTLNQESLWLDEGYILHTTQKGSFLDLLTGEEHVLGHPPFYVSALKVWAEVLGYQPSTARLFSVIAGTCIIPLLYLLCKRLFDQRTAVIAALFLTLSSFHIHYSQELHSYTLLALEVMLAMFFLVRLLDSPAWKTFAAFALINIIGLHTHLFYLYVLGAHFLVAVLSKSSRRARRMALGSLVIAALLFIPWASTTLMRDWNSLGNQQSYEEFTAQEFFTVLGDFIGISQTYSIPQPPSFYVLMSILMGLAVGITLLLKGRKEGAVQMMALYFLMPILAYNLLETIVGPMSPLGMQSRYLLIIYPAFVILLARGIAMFSMPLSAALMLILLIPSGTSLYYEYTSLTKEDWRGAAEYIRQNFSSGIPVLVLPHWTYHPLQVYLRDDGALSREGDSPFTFYLIYEPETFQPGDLPQKIIVVTSNRHLETSDNEVLQYLDKEYASSARRGFFGGIDVGLYMKNQLPEE